MVYLPAGCIWQVFFYFCLPFSSYYKFLGHKKAPALHKAGRHQYASRKIFGIKRLEQREERSPKKDDHP